LCTQAALSAARRTQGDGAIHPCVGVPRGRDAIVAEVATTPRQRFTRSSTAASARWQHPLRDAGATPD
jgi:hypothetical protein